MTDETTVRRGENAPLPEAMAAPTAEAVQRGEEARAKLEARGLEMWVETKWWGFQVHMNEETAEVVSEIEDLIADIVDAVIPKFGKLVAVGMKIHAAWIKAVNGEWGVKCSSPWFGPAWLIPTRRSAPDYGDVKLWWTVYEPGQGWNEDQKFEAHKSASNPALAEYSGRVYCAHRGWGGSDNQLWWTVYDPETGWSEDIQFPDHMSSAGPALAVYNNKLHCVHKGVHNESLWHTTFDGTRWSTDIELPAHKTSTGPGLAVYGGKLHCVHKARTDGTLWHTTFDGTRWSTDTALPAHNSAANPALAVYNNKLHCVHRGTSDDTALWHTTFDGNRWSPDTKLPGHASLEGPGLAVFDNKLYCIHRGYGSGDQQLWWSYYNGSSWSRDQRFPAHSSGAGPAAIAYRDTNGTRDQLLVVHRGYGPRAAGTDSAEMDALIAAEERAAAAVTGSD